MHRGVDREDRRRRRSARRRSRRVGSTSAPSASAIAGRERREHEGAGSRAPVGPSAVADEGAAPRPGRCRSRSPRPPGTVPTCQKLQPSSVAGRPAGRPRTRRRATANRKIRAAARTFTARLFENICLNFALLSGVPSSPRISDEHADQRAADQRREDQQRRLEADEREQQPAEEEADALERVLRAGEDRDPAEQRRSSRPRGTTSLTALFELIFVRSLAMPDSAWATIT